METTHTATGDFIAVQSVADLGQGFVAEVIDSGIDGRSETRVDFGHCATGQGVRATTFAAEDGRTLQESAADPVPVMRSALAAAETLSLADVVARMHTAGIAAQTTSTEFQTCGCAVFYPEAIGDKRAYAF